MYALLYLICGDFILFPHAFFWCVFPSNILSKTTLSITHVDFAMESIGHAFQLELNSDTEEIVRGAHRIYEVSFRLYTLSF